MRIRFGQRSAAVEDPWHQEDLSELPDMTTDEWSGRPETPPRVARGPRFRLEVPELLPPGTYAAELVDWQEEGPRVRWLFQVVPESDLEPGARERLEWLTGTICRPCNHLHLLLAALRALPDGTSEEAFFARSAELRAALDAAEPDALLGRRCRVRVEHVQDELGDCFPRIVALAPQEPF